MSDTIEMLLSSDKEQTAMEVLEFVEGLNQEQQQEMINFLNGAKFAMSLKNCQ